MPHPPIGSPSPSSLRVRWCTGRAQGQGPAAGGKVHCANAAHSPFSLGHTRILRPSDLHPQKRNAAALTACAGAQAAPKGRGKKAADKADEADEAEAEEAPEGEDEKTADKSAPAAAVKKGRAACVLPPSPTPPSPGQLTATCVWQLCMRASASACRRMGEGGDERTTSRSVHAAAVEKGPACEPPCAPCQLGVWSSLRPCWGRLEGRDRLHSWLRAGVDAAHVCCLSHSGWQRGQSWTSGARCPRCWAGLLRLRQLLLSRTARQRSCRAASGACQGANPIKDVCGAKDRLCCSTKKPIKETTEAEDDEMADAEEAAADEPAKGKKRAAPKKPAAKKDAAPKASPSKKAKAK